MHPKHLQIKDFDYELPGDRIAKYPVKPRDQSRLLVYQSGIITDHRFDEISSLMPSGTHLVFNNTKVVQARLHFTTKNNKQIEVFCLEPTSNDVDITLAMGKKKSVDWICLVGGNRKWKQGPLEKNLVVGAEEIHLHVKRIESFGGTFLIRFSWTPAHFSFAEILERAGETPLPPYLNRKAEAGDKVRYQTIYAQREGSVAAPTAGLHFTGRVMRALKKRGIQLSEVTLHVGAGTFKPVSAEQLVDHAMHHEFIDVPLGMIKKLSDNLKQRIVPVGTTSMRTVESLYWMGVKILEEDRLLSSSELEITQWYPYERSGPLPSPGEALDVLVNNLEFHNLTRLVTRTQLMIAPGYQPAIASGLITNYHQPKSTLLVLVAALVGDDWKKIYRHALENDYRFLSYGDSNLLWFGGEN